MTGSGPHDVKRYSFRAETHQSTAAGEVVNEQGRSDQRPLAARKGRRKRKKKAANPGAGEAGANAGLGLVEVLATAVLQGAACPSV